MFWAYDELSYRQANGVLKYMAWKQAEEEAMMKKAEEEARKEQELKDKALQTHQSFYQ